ncbi:MAG: NUDIX hydrolase [Anaerolineae bacterium]|jgi:ADP-ribose pyrophosphatase|nr:NUDIX hydrolase [Anaerolineae bacterium]
MTDTKRLEENTLDRQPIYHGRVVKLDLVTVTLPDGQSSQREIITHPGAVAIVALDEAQNVLMVRQFRLAAGRVMLEIPAGTLEPNEAPLICAERELQEETGYKPRQLEPIGGIFVAPGYTTEYIHLFRASDLVESRLEMDSDEFIEVVKIPFQQALDMVDNGEIQDAKSIAGLLRVARQLATQ